MTHSEGGLDACCNPTSINIRPIRKPGCRLCYNRAFCPEGRLFVSVSGLPDHKPMLHMKSH